MRLLKPQEREVAFKKERSLAQIQAAELSQEVSALIKSFNKTKTKIENDKKSILAEYIEWRSSLEQDKDGLQKSILKLIEERDTALEPLYKKEEELKKLSSSLKKRETILITKESDVRVREKDAKELKSIADAVYEKISSTEKDVAQREKNLQKRLIKFEKHMKGQREFFKQNEQKLRDWLEKERAKLK